MLGIAKKTTKEMEKIPVAEIIKLIQSPSTNWAQAWNDVLILLYNKEYKAIPGELAALFTSQFEANQFSVVSYSKVGRATQGIAALVEKNETAATQSSNPFVIRKLYWL